MSGGSMDYIYCKLESSAIGMLMDKELEDMLKDFVALLHDCEWAHDSDISDEEYFETVKKFKDKWFGNRDERLKDIVNQSIEELRLELMRMIGEK